TGTKKYFSRTLARDKDGRAIEAARVGLSCDSRSGINCKNEATSRLSANGKESKNSFNVNIRAQVRFINITITERIVDNRITATFNNTAAAGTTNAILVSTTATGKGGSNIIDDVNEIRLNGFAFNIGTESR
ncbi:MAG: hypothetical protein SPI08_00480, partial [Campylobacter sp.]|nr:hypothetical protein [Campylobacter sp.]